MWSIFLTSLLSVSPLLQESQISSNEFAERRAALAREIQTGLFFIEGEKEQVLDLRFLQDDDFYYLTGVDAQDAAFLLVADKGKIEEEILFLPAYNKDWERWNGTRLSPGEDAEKLTGIRKTADNKKIKEFLDERLPKGRRVYCFSQESKRRKKGSSAPAVKSNVLQDALEGQKLVTEDARASLDAIQVRKSDKEVEFVTRAIRITELSFGEAMKYLKPGAFEYELMGAIEGNYLRLGAEGFAFPSIVGSGPNTCNLHYEKNRRQMQDGELVVMDIGAKYQHYCADVTRTVPVNGKFNPRQAEIYNLVLEAQKRAMAAAKPGVLVSAVDAAARQYLTEQKHAQNFWHGTSHFVGLKVHDTPTSYALELEPGMIITVEPGIYLPKENIGVRIEDDILITKDGCQLLSSEVPREIPELEAWIQKHKSP